MNDMLAKLTKVSASHGGPSLTSAIQRESMPHHHTMKNAIEVNPIHQYFEIGPEVASAGPELAWKIHAARRKTDQKVSHFLSFLLQSRRLSRQTQNKQTNSLEIPFESLSFVSFCP
jgi:hypothetical protein